MVPFRLTGNIEWGVPAPVLDGEIDNLGMARIIMGTDFVYKDIFKTAGKPEDEWEKYWKSTDSEVFQFIGQDNIYFYGIAEMAMFIALQGKENLTAFPSDGQYTLPHACCQQPYFVS